MRLRFRFSLVLAASVLVGLTSTARAKAIAIAVPQSPAAQAVNADAIVVGKVTGVEAEPVEVTAFPGGDKDAKMSFKVAVVKVDTALLGGGGLTRFRVGFPADAPPAAKPGEPQPPGGPLPLPAGGRLRRPARGATAVALTAGMEGCFALVRHHEGDFYTLVGPPLLKGADNYGKELDRVKVVVKAIDDPVPALKAKELDARFQAALSILQRYQTARGLRPGRAPAREAIPEEENKLIVAMLKELPWLPKDPQTDPGVTPPSRSALWYLANPAESGYKDPVFPAQAAGAPPVDYNKIMDDATTKFLTESGDKIKIKRFVSK